MDDQSIEHAFFSKTAKTADSEAGSVKQVAFMLCIEKTLVSSKQLDELLGILDDAVAKAKAVFD